MSQVRARKLVAERSGGVCEVCYAARATSWHHRQPRSQGGRWSPENGLHTCGDGTTGCHGWIEQHRQSAYHHGWLVRSWQHPAEVPVLLRYFGWVLLDRHGGIQLSMQDNTPKENHVRAS